MLGTNILVAVIVYDRRETINLWLKAYNNAIKPENTKIAVIHNYDGEIPNKLETGNIVKWMPDFYIPRENIGQDIGAFRDSIRNPILEPWDVLLWCTDDNIPVHHNFISKFTDPIINNEFDFVGNYWVKHENYPKKKPYVHDHFRTTCFALNKKAAYSLIFPDPLLTKTHCYNFEWAHPELNMTKQLFTNGFRLTPVHMDWTKKLHQSNSYIWDVAMFNNKSQRLLFRRDFKSYYEKQFKK